MTVIDPMKRGLSLVEMLVGITIFTMAFLPIMDLFRGQVRQVGLTRHHLLAQEKAQVLLQAEVDRLLMTRFAAPSSEGRSPEAAREMPVLETPFMGQVEALPSETVKGLWEIRARVAWSEGVGAKLRRRELTLVRLLSDPMGGAS